MKFSRRAADKSYVSVRFLSSQLMIVLGLLFATFAVLADASAVKTADTPLSTFADTVFEHLNQVAGLPGQVVTALAQDGSGFLWVGTQVGLARWDGYHFRVYKAGRKSTGSLPDNIIKALHTDKRGRLWIGTNAGGLSLYQPETDQFVTYAAGPSGLSHVRVRAIADDGQRGLWVGTEGGLDHFDFETGAIRQFHDGGQLDGQRISALLEDRRGALWVATENALFWQAPRRAGEQRPFVPVKISTSKGAAPRLLNLFEDSAGRIWMGTTQGAYAIERDNPAALPKLLNEGVWAIAEGRPGEIWFGTQDSGIVKLQVATRQTRRIIHDAAMPTSLAENEVRALLVDRSGLLWAGTKQGLSRCDPVGTGLSTLFSSSAFLAAARRTPGDVLSMLALDDGQTWLGLSNGGGIDMISRFGLRANRRGLPGRVLAMAASKLRDVYIGASQGLYRTDREGQALVHLPIPGRDPNALVNALFMDEETLWAGGSDGLWRIRFDAGGGVESAIHVGTAQGLTDERIIVIRRRGGSLWVGTQNGLNRIELDSLAVERIPADPENPAALGCGMISAILIDRHQRLWIASFGGGVSVLDERSQVGSRRFEQIGTVKGLLSASIDNLLQDDSGKVWASSEDGLAAIDPKTFAVRPFRRAEGAAIQAYWTGIGAVTRGGEVVFSGVGGITIVNPDRVREWKYRPPIVITGVSLGGADLIAGRFQGKGVGAPLRLEPGVRSLAVEFSALDYSAPERNRYSYRLDGFDSKWIDTPPGRRVAEYTNLPVGDFVLRLRGSNRDGEWAPREIALTVHVIPAWNQTAGFRIAEGLASVALLALLVQLRTAYLRRSQRALEREVAKRTNELETRTGELRRSRNELEQLAYFDSLTGLPNRRRFAEDFGRLLGGVGFTLLLIDLDRFKEVNDTLGHDAGDALLTEVADRLRALVRASECVARLGGDEFAILLKEERDSAVVEGVCRRIVDSLSAPVMFRGNTTNISPSIGVAVHPRDGETQEALYKAADLALYEAKRGGGNGWRGDLWRVTRCTRKSSFARARYQDNPRRGRW